MNTTKQEMKRLDDLAKKLREKLDRANSTNTNPVEIGRKDLADALYYLDMLREETQYRTDHYAGAVTYTQMPLPGMEDVK